MAHLYECIYKQNKYYDKALCANYDDWKNAVINSRTVYVGNLSVHTKREHIKQHMEKVGEVDRVIMGLNRIEKTPCGFCFVVYKLKQSASEAVNILDGSILDSRMIRVDEDLGFVGSRRYGRGKTGAQKGDERSSVYDEERPIILPRELSKDIFNKNVKENNNADDTMKGYTNNNINEMDSYNDNSKQRSGNLYRTLNRGHSNYLTQNNNNIINNNPIFNNNYNNSNNKNYTKNKWHNKLDNNTHNNRHHTNYNSGKNMNWKTYNNNNNNSMNPQGENKYVRKTIHKKRYQRTPNYTLQPKPLYNTVNMNERANLGKTSTLYPKDKNISTFNILNGSKEAKEEE